MVNRREFLEKGVVVGAAAAGSWPKGIRAMDEPQEVGQLVAQTGSLVVDGTNVSALTDDYIGQMRSAGVDVWVHNRVSTESSGLPYFTRVHDYADRNSDRLALVTTVREMREAKAAGKLAMVMGWQAATPFEGVLSDWSRKPPSIDLRAYYELGLRSCGITYNISNRFGGGCTDEWNGLTLAGRYIVERFHEMGIVVDVGGHTGERASLDVVEGSPGVPIICSHTNCRALMDNPRNTTDRVIEGVAATGGVVGMTALNDFVARSRNDVGIRTTPQVGIDALLEHYDHVRRLVGAEHVGIGTDFTAGFPGTDPYQGEGSFIAPAIVYSAQETWTYVEGFETITELPNLREGLRRRGWSTGDIENAMGNNWTRVFQQVWGK